MMALQQTRHLLGAGSTSGITYVSLALTWNQPWDNCLPRKGACVLHFDCILDQRRRRWFNIQSELNTVADVGPIPNRSYPGSRVYGGFRSVPGPVDQDAMRSL